MNREHYMMANAMMSRLGSRRMLFMGIGLLLLAQLGILGRTWISAQGSGVLGAPVALSVSGWSASSVLGAGLTVQATALIVMLTTRKWGQRISALVFLLSTVGASIATIGIGLDPAPVARSAALAQTGVTTVTTEPQVHPWPWVSIAVGVIAALWIVVGVLQAKTWSRAMSKYEARERNARLSDVERPTAAQEDPQGADLIDLWDALSNDPTSPASAKRANLDDKH